MRKAKQEVVIDSVLGWIGLNATVRICLQNLKPFPEYMAYAIALYKAIEISKHFIAN